ncbi:MAG: hypothetical protein FWK01_21675 [Pantanalinema sp. GBBB05]|nr:hypothetical protein [Pantanalinema sp. GBBB05]
MKRVLLALVLAVALPLTGCASFGNSLSLSTSKVVGGDYRVTLYSGGKAVREWQLKSGFVNEEEGSDGWYFNCKNHTIRISGDVVVEALSGSQQQANESTVCD